MTTNEEHARQELLKAQAVVTAHTDTADIKKAEIAMKVALSKLKVAQHRRR